jgi:hypothetical protein
MQNRNDGKSAKLDRLERSMPRARMQDTLGDAPIL